MSIVDNRQSVVKTPHPERKAGPPWALLRVKASILRCAATFSRRRFMTASAGAAVAFAAGSNLALRQDVFAQDETRPVGGELKFALSNEPPNLDPHQASALIVATVDSAILDTLVNELADGTIVPGLATSWEFSPDGLTATFHLLTGVKFHDGEPFNAAAMKAIVRPDGRSCDQVRSRGQSARSLHRQRSGRRRDADDDLLQTLRAVAAQPRPQLHRPDLAEGDRRDGTRHRDPSGRHRSLRLQGVDPEGPHHLRALRRLQLGARLTSASRDRRRSTASSGGRWRRRRPASRPSATARATSSSRCRRRSSASSKATTATPSTST